MFSKRWMVGLGLVATLGLAGSVSAYEIAPEIDLDLDGDGPGFFFADDWDDATGSLTASEKDFNLVKDDDPTVIDAYVKAKYYEGTDSNAGLYGYLFEVKANADSFKNFQGTFDLIRHGLVVDDSGDPREGLVGWDFDQGSTVLGNGTHTAIYTELTESNGYLTFIANPGKWNKGEILTFFYVSTHEKGPKQQYSGLNGGPNHGFGLAPAPEPSILIFMGAGLLGLVPLRRRYLR